MYCSCSVDNIFVFPTRMLFLLFPLRQFADNDEREIIEDCSGPYLLQCAIKEEDNVLPMTPPGANIDEMLLEV